MSQSKKIAEYLTLEENSQSQNLLLRYEEPGKPRATFGVDTPEKFEYAINFVKKCGIDTGEY